MKAASEASSTATGGEKAGRSIGGGYRRSLAPNSRCAAPPSGSGAPKAAKAVRAPRTGASRTPRHMAEAAIARPGRRSRTEAGDMRRRRMPCAESARYRHGTAPGPRVLGACLLLLCASTHSSSSGPGGAPPPHGGTLRGGAQVNARGTGEAKRERDKMTRD